jgi:Domain of unknown function (DUF1905)/Bacteriocin-protection, YdeI or OmpD-Associated
MSTGKGQSGRCKILRFDAALERMRSRLNWIIIHIPYDAAKFFGVRGQVRIAGTINGFPFRSSLFPTREGRHILLVNKKMQKGARATPGAVAHFEIEPDREGRPAKIPNELQQILAENRSLRRWHDGLNPSTRHEIAKWVGEPKGTDSRKRRAQQIAERLLETMEAEAELPPILQIAFARSPRARDGWNLMSLSRPISFIRDLLLPNARGSIEAYKQNGRGRNRAR